MPMLNELIKLRRILHQYPELSGEESDTAQRIEKFVKHHHETEIIRSIGGEGLAVVYDFLGEGPTIAIRCELDALPIEEENQFSYRSEIEGVSHKCGHDGHMAIVAGLIFWIRKQNFKSGKIILLFQPAEENGQGAYRMLEDERIAALNIDYIFALHNIPGEKMHSILLMKKGFSAEVQSCAIKLSGKESHAAEPEKGINPAVTISEIIADLEVLNLNNPYSVNFAVLTPVHINMGQKSYGISPANGEVHYTIRTWNAEKMKFLKSQITTFVNEKCSLQNVDFTIDWFEHFPAAQNEMTCNKIIKQAAESSNLKLIEKPYPFKFGEDFGWFSKKYKTGMFGLGAGKNTPALHSTNYDFPDELIKTGVDIFKAVILTARGEE